MIIRVIALFAAVFSLASIARHRKATILAGVGVRGRAPTGRQSVLSEGTSLSLGKRCDDALVTTAMRTWT